MSNTNNMTIENKRDSLVQGINISSLLENFGDSQTIETTHVMEHVVNKFNNNEYTNISNIVRLTSVLEKYTSIDSNIYTLHKNITEGLDNFDAKLVVVHESISNEKDSVFKENALEILESLASKATNDAIDAIRNGVLSRLIPHFKQLSFLIESYKITTDRGDKTMVHESYHPYGVLEIGSKSITFSLGKNVFTINESGIEKTSPKNSRFQYMMNVLESSKIDDVTNNIIFENKDSVYKMSLDTKDTKIILESKMVVEGQTSDQDSMMIFENSKDLKDKNYRATNTNKAFGHFIDGLIVANENKKMITHLDNVLVVENRSSKDKVAIIKNPLNKNYHVLVVESHRLPMMKNTYTNVLEALSQLKSLINYDASKFYASDILEHNNIVSESMKEAQTINEVILIAESKKVELLALMEDAKLTRDSGNIKFIAESLETVDNLIIEQKNILATKLNGVV